VRRYALLRSSGREREDREWDRERGAEGETLDAMAASCHDIKCNLLVLRIDVGAGERDLRTAVTIAFRQNQLVYCEAPGSESVC